MIAKKKKKVAKKAPPKKAASPKPKKKPAAKPARAKPAPEKAGRKGTSKVSKKKPSPRGRDRPKVIAAKASAPKKEEGPKARADDRAEVARLRATVMAKKPQPEPKKKAKAKTAAETAAPKPTKVEGVKIVKIEKIEKIEEPPPVVVKEEAVTQKVAAAPEKKRVLRVARGEQRPMRTTRREEDPVEKARAALAKVGDDKKNGELKDHRGPILEINPRLESSRDKIESRPDLPLKPMSVAEKKRAEAEAQFAKIAPQHEQLNQHFHKSPFDMHISERDSLATQVRLSRSDEEALTAAMQLVERYKLPPDQAVLTRIVGLGDARLTKVALEELLELDDKGRVRATSDLIETLTRLVSKDAETVELKDLLLEKVGVRS